MRKGPLKAIGKKCWKSFQNYVVSIYTHHSIGDWTYPDAFPDTNTIIEVSHLSCTGHTIRIQSCISSPSIVKALHTPAAAQEILQTACRRFVGTGTRDQAQLQIPYSVEWYRSSCRNLDLNWVGATKWNIYVLAIIVATYHRNSSTAASYLNVIHRT